MVDPKIFSMQMYFIFIIKFRIIRKIEFGSVKMNKVQLLNGNNFNSIL